MLTVIVHGVNVEKDCRYITAKWLPTQEKASTEVNASQLPVCGGVLYTCEINTCLQDKSFHFLNYVIERGQKVIHFSCLILS